MNDWSLSIPLPRLCKQAGLAPLRNQGQAQFSLLASSTKQGACQTSHGTKGCKADPRPKLLQDSGWLTPSFPHLQQDSAPPGPPTQPHPAHQRGRPHIPPPGLEPTASIQGTTPSPPPRAPPPPRAHSRVDGCEDVFAALFIPHSLSKTGHVQHRGQAVTPVTKQLSSKEGAHSSFEPLNPCPCFQQSWPITEPLQAAGPGQPQRTHAGGGS